MITAEKMQVLILALDIAHAMPKRFTVPEFTALFVNRLPRFQAAVFVIDMMNAEIIEERQEYVQLTALGEAMRHWLPTTSLELTAPRANRS